VWNRLGGEFRSEKEPYNPQTNRYVKGKREGSGNHIKTHKKVLGDELPQLRGEDRADV
jgi:hypothetical protein